MTSIPKPTRFLFFLFLFPNCVYILHYTVNSNYLARMANSWTSWKYCIRGFELLSFLIMVYQRSILQAFYEAFYTTIKGRRKVLYKMFIHHTCIDAMSIYRHVFSDHALWPQFCPMGFLMSFECRRDAINHDIVTQVIYDVIVQTS